MNCGLLGIICLLGLPTGVLFGVSYIVPLLTSSIFTYISVLFLLTYNAFQGFILFLLVTVLNSDLRNQWKKLLCGCIKKKRQASSRQDKLREHAINRMNKTSKMAQGITEGQHQDENMEELHDTDTHTSHNIVKNTNTLHVNMLDHHQQTSYSKVQNSTVNYQVLVSQPILNIPVFKKQFLVKIFSL